LLSFIHQQLVKLTQTATGRQIRESIVVHHYGNDEVSFELSSRVGYFLRVRENGSVGKKQLSSSLFLYALAILRSFM
jgi:hypothetical protein